jgi:cobalamin biosynthesis protein CbiG
MNLQEKENYQLLHLTDSFADLEEHKDALSSQHLVVEVSENLNIDDSKISLLLSIASSYKENGMSFVVIKSGIDIDDFPETLNIVPTLQEAEDVLEMEAIERDLGF